jgi:hypothetical protein
MPNLFSMGDDGEDQRLPGPAARQQPVRRRLRAADVGNGYQVLPIAKAPLWDEINALLARLQPRYQLKVRRLQRDLKWLRRQAAFYELPWGKK